MLSDASYKSRSTRSACDHLPLRPIGWARSCYPEKFATPRQSGVVPSARAWIELIPELQPENSLRGLEGFSHLWILYWFHQNSLARFSATVRPPRAHGQNWGLFATRSPHRPNPIGLSLLKLESVEANGIWVSGVDFIEGTPILDIKPYLPESDHRTEVSIGWVADVESQHLSVKWTAQAEQDLTKFVPQDRQEALKNLISTTLQEDPRPRNQRNVRREGGFYVYEWNVRYSIEGNQIWISSLGKRNC